MKKRNLLLIVGLIILGLFVSSDYQPEELSKATNVPPEDLKVLIKFKEGQFSPEVYEHNIDDINSFRVRGIFKDFCLFTMKAVFKNRYDENGRLKQNLPASNQYYLEGWQEILFTSKYQAEHFITTIIEQPEIEQALIEEPILIKAAIAPNDPEYVNNNQWHLNNPAQPASDIDAQAAWDINRGRNDVVIGILDGGVDYTHTDLDPGNRSRVIAGKDTGDGDNDPMDNLPDNDPESFAGHGTSVAGVVGAITDNGQQVSGVMWNCKIMPVKMVRSGGIRIPHIINWDWSTTAFPSDVADAVDYAVNNGAHVINLSYSFPDMNWPINEVILRVPLIFQAFDNAYKNNVVITASMGNYYETDNGIRYPAGFSEQVIAVGASTPSNTRASFSNTGAHISVVAPGTGIRTIARGGGIRNVSGTSFSAPLTAGVAGLILSQGKDRNFNLTNDDVRHILELTAVDVPNYGIGFDNETGYGIINANKALQLLDEPNVLYHYNSTGGTSVKTQTFSQWILLDNRWGIAAGTYLSVDQYKITKHVTFDIPFCSTPKVWMRERESKSLSYGNPNNGHPYSKIMNISNTGFDLEYVTYYVRYNSLGQTINQWIPAAPTSTNVAYTTVGEPNPAALAGPVLGSSTVCSTNSTFTLSNVPVGSTVTWQATPANLFSVSSGTGSSATLSAANSTVSGSGTLTFTIGSACGGTPIQIAKTVWVGKPTITFVQKRCFDTEALYEFTTPYISGAKYLWSINNPNLAASTGGNTCYVSGEPGSPSQSYVLTLQIQQGNCTVSTTRSGVYADCPGGGPRLNAYPNPASSELVVSYQEDSLQTTDVLMKEAIQLELINAKSEKVYSNGTRNSRTVIPVDKLPEGIYSLHVINREGVIRRQILIDR